MTSHIVHRRVAFAGTTAVLLALHASSLFAAGIPQAVLAEKHRAVLKDHCVSCHGAENQKGTFRVDDLPFTITTIEVAEKWQKVLNAINAGRCRRRMKNSPPRTRRLICSKTFRR